ncbi:unnamed protein product [Periconia digitata]|uniref:Uncharacterized protein n=1 Tax=Periconia digitata TaxID=1303443 RepID=A0A9W4XPS4_9PLEO|nr:unnamed protein product [Periconia digitata]
MHVCRGKGVVTVTLGQLSSSLQMNLISGLVAFRYNWVDFKDLRYSEK